MKMLIKMVSKISFRAISSLKMCLLIFVLIPLFGLNLLCIYNHSFTFYCILDVIHDLVGMIW